MPRPIRLEVYRDPRGFYRWRAIAGNGRMVGASEEGFSRRAYATAKAKAAFPDGEVR